MVPDASAEQGDALSEATSAWVEMFIEGWRSPEGPETFADHFEPWLDPSIRLVQPQLPPTVGRAAFREQFVRPLFRLVPDLHGTVEGWAARGNRIYIELRLDGSVSGRPVSMHTCDRITLRNSVAIERVAHLDPISLLAAIARTPRSWPQFVRQQIASRRST